MPVLPPLNHVPAWSKPSKEDFKSYPNSLHNEASSPPTTVWNCLPSQNSDFSTRTCHHKTSPTSVPAVVTSSAPQLLLPPTIPKANSRPTHCLQGAEAWENAWPKGPRPVPSTRQLTPTTHLPSRVYILDYKSLDVVDGGLPCKD